MKLSSIFGSHKPALALAGLAGAMAFALLLAVTPLVHAQGASPATAPTTLPTAAPAGSTVLFNGKDLTGWRIHFDDKTVDPTKVWTVADGVLKLNTKIKGYVLNETVRSNYHLHVEWCWPKDAPPRTNSGVFVHVHGPDAVWPLCFECQLQPGSTGMVTGTGLDIPSAPMISNRKRAQHTAPDSEKPAGEWNAYDIFARDNTLEVRVNGVVQNKLDNLPAKEGGIALQMEGYPIDFRNIWVQPN